jgi:heavy metal translocating P-type ATPase
MKFYIKHSMTGRLRVHMDMKHMSFKQADILEYYIKNIETVTSVKVYEKTCDAVIEFSGDKVQIINALKHFTYSQVAVPDDVLNSSGREMNSYYQDKLVNKVFLRAASKLFLPISVRNVVTTVKSVKYIGSGIKTLLKGKMEVPVLDATAIGVSILRNDFNTAGSVMFLLGIGEIIEEWTHKKSVGDLARTMSLNVSKVWLKTADTEVLVPVNEIKNGDEIIVHVSNVIPFDGVVVTGEAMVNQASLTGEAVPVNKNTGSAVFAGTVIEEGELTIKVKQSGGNSKYDKIVKMIEESEKLKSGLESKAEHLADSLVPYTLGGTALTYLLTRNVTKALSILMVDFSCALKLAMPITVLSAIRQAGQNDITVKGGKFLEAVADADTIVFDKTGTLTKAAPTVKYVYSFNGDSEDELLRMAACMEEHFPHSMAKAVVDAAAKKNLRHEEMHTKVEYIVAHGISTTINNKKTIIGSYHFVFEDEGCTVPEGRQEMFDKLPEEYSHLYLAIEDKLAAVICIEDPVRPEAKEVISSLKELGISKVVMMTGDSERTAKAIAGKVGVDEYYSEVLPEDKASFVENEKAAGRKVIMIGDGINDSPALSAADVGIAISDGAQIAREIADITVSADDLGQIVYLKDLSNNLIRKINRNYRTIVSFNSGLIALGVLGVIQPTTSALLHNTSTLFISMNSMKNIPLAEEQK